MKFYILCDIEGVASLACWDEARSANACYAHFAQYFLIPMSLHLL